MASTSAASTAIKLPIWRRIGDKVVESFKNLTNDYTTVMRETATGCKEHPIRTGILATAFGFVTYAYRTNPSEASFYNTLCEKRDAMVLIPESTHSERSDGALSLRTQLSNERRLRYYNLLFCSILVKAPHDEGTRIYQSQDPNLRRWPWQEVWEGLLDVGCFGKWHNLEKAFM
ncbi:hypothetical protein WR25_25437 [Diploscapter pachys]|uniref:Uncharacterized protein n=1 Tax=Diploscapter pachys TaxID=2018661 RepID=A0A2A2J2Z8_9BILA|nr:hypothetical protein WR25_25437 [Diploscapter pachys]